MVKLYRVVPNLTRQKMGDSNADENEKNIEMYLIILTKRTIISRWKIKKLIKNLQEAKGNGTSMISLIIPPKDQVSRVSKLLGDEYGTASNIKSRGIKSNFVETSNKMFKVNRLSVLSAITSAQQRLKLYNKIPTNGSD